jgi:hypothetical protein
MKYLTATALAALLVGSIAVSGLVPAFADDAAATQPPALAAAGSAPPDQTMARGSDAARPGMMGHWGQRGQMGRLGGRRANLLDIACGDRGAEALEIAFVHVKYSVEPTAEQQPLLDSLRTAALADQKTFADTCKANRGDGTAAASTTLLDRLQARLAIETAKVAALNDVLPKFKAFYDSLTDAQKAKREPRRWGGPRVGFNQWHRPGQGQDMWGNGPGGMRGPGAMHRPGMNGMQPPAPDATSAPMPDDSQTPASQS